MKIVIKSFSKLTTEELYAILQLRSAVFVVEQDCVYQDVDGKDQKSLHVFGLKNNTIVAYTRIFKPGHYFNDASIGRVVIAKNYRKFGYGHQIMVASINAIKNYYNTTIITISAQEYLKEFYNSHGFTQVGSGYLEDNIPHIKMTKLD
jgi:Predicted acyltransferase